MRENEVADRVCTLDGMGVVCEGIQEPWVFGGYEGVGLLIGPKLSARVSPSASMEPAVDMAHLVLVVLMQVDAAPLSLSPLPRHAVVDVRLVYDLWNQLWPAVDQGRVWGGKLGPVDRILGAIFDQERQECEDAADEEGDDEEVDDEEDDEAATHACGLSSAPRDLDAVDKKLQRGPVDEEDG